jgi:hypothetical protein
MHLFELWWLIIEYIFFQYFIFIHYINYLGKRSYHMLLEILTIVFHYKNALNAFLTMLIDWIDYTLLIFL